MRNSSSSVGGWLTRLRTPAAVSMVSTSAEGVRVHLAADPVTGDVETWDAGQSRQPRRRAGQFGIDGGAGQMAQVGEGPALNGPPRPDDRHPVTERLDLAQDVAGQQHRGPVVPQFLDTPPGRPLPSAGPGPPSAHPG